MKLRLNEIDIEHQLDKYVNSHETEIRKKIREKTGEKYYTNLTGYESQYLTDEEVLGYTWNKLENVYLAICEVVPSITLYDKQDLFSVHIYRHSNGITGRVNIFFNQEVIRRESLCPKKYPEGVDNIIRLISTGYDTEGRAVYGKWHGKNIKSLAHRDSNPFLQEVIDELNDEIVDGSFLFMLSSEYRK